MTTSALYLVFTVTTTISRDMDYIDASGKSYSSFLFRFYLEGINFNCGNITSFRG
jgi:hypothetical protein